jgi:hypothetical protein
VVLLLSIACVCAIFGIQLAFEPAPNSRSGFERATGFELCSAASVERATSEEAGRDVYYRVRLIMPEECARQLYASVSAVSEAGPCEFPHCRALVGGDEITIDRAELLGGVVVYEFTSQG